MGVAENPVRRWKEHANAAKRGCSGALYAAVRKYGWDNFKKKILVHCDYDYALSLEVKAISAYSTLAPNGYNLTLGGEGVLGFKFSQASKDKMSASAKKLRPPEVWQKIASVGRASAGKNAVESGRLKALSAAAGRIGGKMSTSVRYKCGCCDLETIAPSMGRHHKKTGHSGKTRLEEMYG